TLGHQNGNTTASGDQIAAPASAFGHQKREAGRGFGTGRGSAVVVVGEAGDEVEVTFADRLVEPAALFSDQQAVVEHVARQRRAGTLRAVLQDPRAPRPIGDVGTAAVHD